MTRMTGPDCAVMCNLINIHTYIQCEWHRMTDRMTGPDCAVVCNLINIHVVVVVVVVVVSHIQRIGCQPDKLLYTVANPARGLLNREIRTKEKIWQHIPPTPHPARSEKIN